MFYKIYLKHMYKPSFLAETDGHDFNFASNHYLA